MAVSYYADPEKVKGGLAGYGRAAGIVWYSIIPFVLLGIIGDAADINVGLEPMSWFLLAIGAMLAGIFYRIGWAVSWYLKTNK
jgi:hypothetical protein